MTHYIAYFDASRDRLDGQGVHVTAGFVSTEEKWADFRERWNALLSQRSIGPPFHMTKFARRESQHSSRDRVRFYRRAVVLLKELTHKPLALGVKKIELASAQSQLPGGPYPPYAWSSLGAFVRLGSWARRRDEPNSTAVAVFEEGDPDQAQFLNLCDSFYGDRRGVRIEPKGSAGLEAADLLAWTLRRVMNAKSEPVHRWPDPAERELANLIQRHLPGHAIDWSDLSSIVAEAQGHNA